MPRPRESEPHSQEQGALGEAVRLLREERGLSQEGLADQGAASDFRRLGELERGHANPRFLNLLRLCSALQIPLSQLVARYEHELERRGQEVEPANR